MNQATESLFNIFLRTATVRCTKPHLLAKLLGIVRMIFHLISDKSGQFVRIKKGVSIKTVL